MKNNLYIPIFLILIMCTLYVGLINPFLKLNTQHSQTYPFFAWSLFDQYHDSTHDYVTRVTCHRDPDIELNISSLMDNICLNSRLRKEEQIFLAQIKLTDAVLSFTGNSDYFQLKQELETTLELDESSYLQIRIYKRTYNPKKFYLNREIESYETIATIKAE